MAVILFIGCDDGQESPPNRKCQVLVVLDKTNSVSFTGKLSHLHEKLIQNFTTTYALATQNIQCSHLSITGKTIPFPEVDHFDKAYPPDGDDRNHQQQVQMWYMAKRKWLFDELSLIDSLIKRPCHDNTTDIFPIFSGIQQIQKNNEPWDSINVYIFSDMVNTSNLVNMNSGINTNNAYSKGKSVCQSLINHGQIAAGNTGNLFLTIYTPNNVQNGSNVYQFWKGFFEQWGLIHYHFE